MSFLLALDRSSHKDELANLIQLTLNELLFRKCRYICSPGLYKKSKVKTP